METCHGVFGQRLPMVPLNHWQPLHNSAKPLQHVSDHHHYHYHPLYLQQQDGNTKRLDSKKEYCSEFLLYKLVDDCTELKIKNDRALRLQLYDNGTEEEDESWKAKAGNRRERGRVNKRIKKDEAVRRRICDCALLVTNKTH